MARASSFDHRVEVQRVEIVSRQATLVIRGDDDRFPALVSTADPLEQREESRAPLRRPAAEVEVAEDFDAIARLDGGQISAVARISGEGSSGARPRA